MRKVEQNATESSLDSREINNESTSTNDDITTDNTPRYVPVARKRAMQMDEFEREGLKLLKEPENRHMSFFRAILPSIQEFSDRETLRFQSKVIQIIDENAVWTNIIICEWPINVSPTIICVSNSKFSKYIHF